MSLNPEQVAANNNTPIAIINLSGNSTTVNPGIPITFDGTQSYDPDNTNIIAYNWWYVDGVVKSQGSTADKKIFSYTFTLPAGVNSKTYQIKLTVRDNEYITASKTLTVTITLSGRTEYYLTDHLGSIRTTIDQNGTVIGFDDYDPFGNVLPGRSYNAGTPNDLNKFTGHERDQEGGLDLDYMLARNYDSELGRFYSVDPFYNKFPAWSPYNYTMNKPLIAIDPTGKDTIIVIDKKSKPKDDGQTDNYTATFYLFRNNEFLGSFSGSTYPNTEESTFDNEGKKNGSQDYTGNTIDEGVHDFDNKSGHKKGTQKGLNIDDKVDGKNRTTKGRDKKSKSVTMKNVNVHKGTSNNNGSMSRGSRGCLTINPKDWNRFAEQYNWSSGNTGTATGKIYIHRILE